MRFAPGSAALGIWLCFVPGLVCAVEPTPEPSDRPPALPPRAGQPLPNVVPLPNLPPSPAGERGTGDDVSEPSVSAKVPLGPPALPILTTERRRRFNLVIAGVSTLLASYTADRLLARDLSQSPVSWVPLVGPWWILSEESSRPNPSQGLQALLVVDGLAQLSGLVLTFVGTFLRYDRVVLRLPKSSDDPSTKSPSPPAALPAR